MENTKLEICKKCWGKGRVHGGDENSTWSKTCEDCHGIGFVRVPKTNADRIRAMSDVELAETLVRYDGVYDVYRTDCEGVHYDWVAAVNEELEWLQQPAEGE